MAVVKTGICKFALVLEVFFCAILLAAAVQGTLPILTAVLYAVLSVCGVDWLCRVLLPHPGAVKNTAPARPVPTPVQPVFQVAQGGHAA